MTLEHPSFLVPTDTFPRRHLGLDSSDEEEMLATIGVPSLAALIDETVPADIRLKGELPLPAGRGEHEALADLARIAAENQLTRSWIGLGYHGTIVPPILLRGVLENPSWYTQYTPYQAEISQGRLEALLTFQTMVADLTALPLAGASLLDEATAAAEAMSLCWAVSRRKRRRFLVSQRCHPQTIAVVRTRAEAVGIEVEVGEAESFDLEGAAGVLVQYPDTHGRIEDFEGLAQRVHAAGGLLVVAADILALTLLRPPGEFGADVAIGSTQRFGVPMGYGGPHAAYMATREEFKRQMPGRLIGVSRDALGNPALRMALQTREQHIRRDKATSNICTAQVLLAIMAGMYAVYHGPEGLRAIARRVTGLTRTLAKGLAPLGFTFEEECTFDTLVLRTPPGRAPEYLAAAAREGIDLRGIDEERLGITFDETTTAEDVAQLLCVFGAEKPDVTALAEGIQTDFPRHLARRGEYLRHPVFHAYHTEHEMLRYLHRLEGRDLSLTTSMIPLGSCTMKLNATSEMLPITWPAFAELHPFAPPERAAGYRSLLADLGSWLAAITGFDAVSFQPNAGSQGEFSGMLTIRAYHRSRGQGQRDVCLIPASAHGTNPASAVLAGMRVVQVTCDGAGNVDIEDLERKASEHAECLAAIMITYPSTHGVFEPRIREMCAIVHRHGGQVYLDGANMNAQVGLCRPGDYGADVCHLNLHKTFCIPHGGGGPGMGPICVAEHLSPFLPGHPLVRVGGEQSLGTVAAAPYGSPSILPIPWVYIALMGAGGLRRATEVAILNANYMAARLGEAYSVLFRGATGRVAHEFIIDLRPFEKSAGIQALDVAKRLMDYGFHAPTMSFPVSGTLMIEPTESESKAELDRYCDALLAIREEIRAIEEGRMPREDNPLVHAPHTAEMISADEWKHPYSRQEAAFPAEWVRHHKFWPPVARIDNGYGDKHLVCTCPSVEELDETLSCV